MGRCNCRRALGRPTTRSSPSDPSTGPLRSGHLRPLLGRTSSKLPTGQRLDVALDPRRGHHRRAGRARRLGAGRRPAVRLGRADGRGAPGPCPHAAAPRPRAGQRPAVTRGPTAPQERQSAGQSERPPLTLRRGVGLLIGHGGMIRFLSLALVAVLVGTTGAGARGGAATCLTMHVAPPCSCCRPLASEADQIRCCQGAEWRAAPLAAAVRSDQVASATVPPSTRGLPSGAHRFLTAGARPPPLMVSQGPLVPLRI